MNRGQGTGDRGQGRPNKSKTVIFLLSSVLCPLFSNAEAIETVTIPMQSGVPVKCSADYVDYQWSKKLLVAKGGVTLRYLTMTLQADSMTWNVETGDIEADGHVTLWEGSSKVEAKAIRYNLPNRSALLTSVQARHGPWTVIGREMKKPTERDAYFVDGYLTTCDHPGEPDYKIAAGEIHVVLDDMIEASNLILYAGPLPVFWIPYFSRSLKEGKSPLEIKPGYSTIEGWFVKATYHLFERDGISFDLYGDYLTLLGYGFGAQAMVKYPDQGQSRLYSYAVVNPSSAQKRWQVNMEHQQQVTPEFSVVGRADLVSDERFPTDTNPFFYVSRYLRSFGALTYRLPFGTVVASAYDDEQFSLVDNIYRRTSAELPRLALQTYSVPLGLGFYGGLGLEGIRSVLLPNAFHAQELWGWRMRVTPFANFTIPVYYGMTAGSSINFTSGWDELRADTGVPQGFETITHGYVSSVNAHNEWIPMVATDISYTYGQQLAPLLPKGGVTSNRMNAALSVGRYDRIAVRFSTGYNFLPTPEELTGYLQRYDLVSAELRMQSEGVEYRYATQYDIFRSAFTFVDNTIRTISLKGMEAQAGINFARDASLAPLNLDVYGGVTIPIENMFRLEVAGRYELLNDYMKEQRLGLYWKFIDCWAVRASYAVRTSLVGGRTVDNAFFSLDFRMTAFPFVGPPIPTPVFLY